MQIDFHHAVTYVIARLAGFKHEEAEIVAYCSQYVDDATNDLLIHFDNGALYSRICSAHKILDYTKFNELAAHQIWIPFHFLPGNGGKSAGKDPGSFIEKIVCCPNSPVAKDMVKHCIEDRDKPYSLHRLGITLHVYADTWAHQGFAGVTHEINNIHDLKDEKSTGLNALKMLSEFFGDRFDEKAGRFIGGAYPLGHGAALCFPDLPYLKWSYMTFDDQPKARDNTREFVKAVKEIFKVMKKYRAGDYNYPSEEIDNNALATIKHLLKSIKEKDSDKRHEKWLEEIRKGSFGFPGVDLEYIPKGENSWKYYAIGTTRKKDRKNEMFDYRESFLESHWKMFHDALLAHRFTVIRNILPKYGICSS